MKIPYFVPLKRNVSRETFLFIFTRYKIMFHVKHSNPRYCNWKVWNILYLRCETQMIFSNNQSNAQYIVLAVLIYGKLSWIPRLNMHDCTIYICKIKDLLYLRRNIFAARIYLFNPIFICVSDFSESRRPETNGIHRIIQVMTWELHMDKKLLFSETFM